MSLLIRKAAPEDSIAIFNLIHELAVFEKAPEQVINTPEKIQIHGFGSQPLFTCLVAVLNETVIGMSLCYVRYSTWKGPVLYLEDLIITESQRNKGYGKLLFEQTVLLAQSEGFSRLQWQVLDWNTPAIEFYKSFKSQFDSEWLNAWIDF